MAPSSDVGRIPGRVGTSRKACSPVGGYRSGVVWCGAPGTRDPADRKYEGTVEG